MATLEVLYGGRTFQLVSDGHASVLEALAGESSVAVTSPCGGHARCGKCRIRVIEPPGATVPSEADRRFLSTEELRANVRLACTCPAEDVRCIEVLAHHSETHPKRTLPRFSEPAEPDRVFREAGRLSAAVDIGTTTVAVVLVSAESGEPLCALSSLNRQSIYGADVLSRISHAEARGLSRLSGAIRAQIQRMLDDLAGQTEYTSSDIGTLVVAGNTTMLHLLAEEDPSGIGRAPFVPRFTDSREYSGADFGLSLAPRGRVLLLPCVSAFVGADMVSGAIALGLDSGSETTLLVDIGTNGEIVLRHNGSVWTCSTAAGPAFEGATLYSGVGGIEGGVCSLRRGGASFQFETIGGASPVGICGSGVLDLLGALLDDGIVDETGRMIAPADLPAEPVDIGRAYKDRLVIGPAREPAFVISDPYLFTQADVRKVQLAKAAIAAGIDTLCAEAEIEYADLDAVVLTGGFGQCLDVVGAVRIGLLPGLARGRFVSVDNAAATGAIMVLRNGNTLQRMKRFQEAANYVELSTSACFQKGFIEHMMFPDSAGVKNQAGARET